MSKRLAFSTVCAMAALLAACHKGVPEGQVAATVDGEEVTLQELNTEIQASNLPQGVDKQVAQREALQRIIDRKLILKAARDKKIDKSPEFQSVKQRTDELLLAQAYVKQQQAAVPVPNDSDISKFMSEHSNAFGNREMLQLDQIQFRPAGPGDIKKLSQIEKDHNLDAVATHLTALGIKFKRGKAGLDTAQLPTEVINRINAQPGEPFVIPLNGIITINAVIGHQAAPGDPAEMRQQAVGLWRNQQFGKLVSDKVKELRSSAKITYQTGFAPPADKKAAGARPAAPAAQ